MHHKIKVNKPIVLIGMVGSGKSTIGKKLAQKLNKQFYDSDHVMEMREGLSVLDIHDYRGENYFRAKEEEVIKEILGYGEVVLSTGGNSFMNDSIRQLIKDHGVSVWLYSDIDTTYNRVSRRNTRPGLDTGDKLKIIEQMVLEYYPIYEEADIKVENRNSNVHYIVDDILLKLKHMERS
ncbi:shikimate kinase [Rickettsiales endosymbiont of Peranema trichophorum]|uniref:shikimate kinase n=1 Tax=Rickettsiales endosymbiont of Peranema trichophorum TaxID=2486577 RepID=UPI0010235ED0|nr:shikimate kinase [Rickettsiales endosymbiont of Peranema trichophorum]RZI47603.1 shikimate kinase [Rickettsiales endosymbiont of Peranema trichophorum]